MKKVFKSLLVAFVCGCNLFGQGFGKGKGYFGYGYGGSV